jgi:hypothetical protein
MKLYTIPIDDGLDQKGFMSHTNAYSQTFDILLPADTNTWE